ncbi:MAG: hypothetical protein V4481_03095 [Patescibacteria group bacterium]
MNNDLTIWKGGTLPLLQYAPLGLVITTQQRFFIPEEILVSRFGIVAMTVADKEPGRRCVTYSDAEWTGVEDNGTGHEYPHDSVRRAHFSHTDRGFSIIRIFILPKLLLEIFESDEFLGPPMISKCACKGTVSESFDEMPASPNTSPLFMTEPLVQNVTCAAWLAAGIPDQKPPIRSQWSAWISFHGWFAFKSAVAEAQLSLEKGLENFDDFIGRLTKQPKCYAKIATHEELPPISNCQPP